MARTLLDKAGYEIETLVVQAPANPTAVARHYVMTSYGAVRRTFTSPDWVEIALRRVGVIHDQYQGHIRSLAGGGFLAVDAKLREVGRFGDYMDAEAALLPLRLRCRSHAVSVWPELILQDLRLRAEVAEYPHGQCGNCGNELAGNGECTHPDLHWTTESLKAGPRRLDTVTV
jgi:hypothetical protein